MLRLVDVSFGYAASAVVDSVSLSVKLGERVALIGGNGAGKSTVLKLVAGLERPWAGNIYYSQDREMLRAGADTIARSGIRLAPQGHPVFASMTVRDHLGLARDLASVNVPTQISVSKAFELFPRLHERQNALASALSGGERAFLGLAQLLVAGCSVLLLDEPSAGLAPAAIKELFQLLDIIGHETGATMLIVEQNAAAALQICDRVYVMNSGKIVATGSPDELAVRTDIIDAYLQF
jgi:branched-chain amino acid transport system ATP-binding protein